MLKIQEYLSSGKTLESLKSDYAINFKRHPNYPNLILFKYDQIDSPFGEEIVRECRGIILDESDGWSIVSRAFDKFFNHGEREGEAVMAIDWGTARVQEKVDGSLMVLYSYKGQWHVASSGSPDAGGQVGDFGFTFAELFWKVFHASKAELPVQDGMCYFFELTSPWNKVVVTHKEESLTLLGGRNLVSGHEVPVSSIAYKFPTIKHLREFPLKGWDSLKASHTKTRGLEQEGFVVIDSAFRRVKDKNPEYTALHHIKGSLSRRAFVEVARAGETSEVEVAFPEYAPLLQEIRVRWYQLLFDVESDYYLLMNIESQKDFAILAMKTRCSAALFAVRAKKSPSIREFLRNYRIDNVVSLLGYKADEHIPSMVETES